MQTDNPVVVLVPLTQSEGWGHRESPQRPKSSGTPERIKFTFILYAVIVIKQYNNIEAFDNEQLQQVAAYKGSLGHRIKQPPVLVSLVVHGSCYFVVIFFQTDQIF